MSSLLLMDNLSGLIYRPLCVVLSRHSSSLERCLLVAYIII